MRQRRSILVLFSLTVAGIGSVPEARSQQGFASPVVASTVHGRVVEASDSATGVLGAEVEVIVDGATAATGRAVYTDSAGRFAVRGLRLGVYALVVRSVGFRPLRLRIEVKQEDVDLGRLPLKRLAVSLAEVRINGLLRKVPARYEEIYARGARGIGVFIGREEMDRMPMADVRSVLMRVPNVRVNDRGIEFPRCTDYIGVHSGGSVVSIYIDGTRMFPPPGGGRGTSMNDVFGLVAAKDIQAIEVFKGVAQLPAEFNSNACAVVAIWTRSY